MKKYQARIGTAERLPGGLSGFPSRTKYLVIFNTTLNSKQLIKKYFEIEREREREREEYIEGRCSDVLS